LVWQEQVTEDRRAADPDTLPTAGFKAIMREAAETRSAARANHGKFGLDNLALVVGGSRGAQQTHEWAVRYPIW